MSRDEARQLINTSGRTNTIVCYFTKRNGERRRMVARYFGAPSMSPHLMRVWDLEKGAERCINLDTVQEIKVPHSTMDDQVRRQAHLERLRARMEAIFG